MSVIEYTAEEILDDVERAAGCAVRKLECFEHQYVAEDGRVFSLQHPAWKPIYRRKVKRVRMMDGMVMLVDRRGAQWLVAVDVLVERYWGERDADSGAE